MIFFKSQTLNSRARLYDATSHTIFHTAGKDVLLHFGTATRLLVDEKVAFAELTHSMI